MSRCWGCCQENCGYSGCGCPCHADDVADLACPRCGGYKEESGGCDHEFHWPVSRVELAAMERVIEAARFCVRTAYIVGAKMATLEEALLILDTARSKETK